MVNFEKISDDGGMEVSKKDFCQLLQQFESISIDQNIVNSLV